MITSCVVFVAPIRVQNGRWPHDGAGTLLKRSLVVVLADDPTKRRETDAVSGINWTEEMATLREELEQK